MRILKIISVLFGLTILAAACTGADGDSTAPSITSDATDNGDGNSTTSSSSTTTTTTTETPPETRPTQTVEGAWTETWRVFLGLGAPGITSAGLATNQAAETLERLGLDGTTTAEHYPRLDIITGRPDKGPAEIALTDCVLFDNHPPIWLTGNLTRTDETEDWILDSVDVIDPFGKCVPKEVADAAIAGAQAFWDAQSEFWNPADPNHPLIAETTTGDYRTFLTNLLSRLEPQQVSGNFEGTTPNFGVIRVDSFDQILIENCYEPDLGYGFFLPSGEHVEGSTAVSQGQTSIEEPLLRREADGDALIWKVSDKTGQVNFDCSPGSDSEFLSIH